MTLVVVTSVSRHIEHVPLTDEGVNERISVKPLSVADQAVLKIILADALSQLTATQRHRFLMHYYQGFSQKEIADWEGCTTQAVNSSIEEARKKLKALLND